MNEYQINVALNGRFMFRTDWEQDKQRAMLAAQTIKLAMPLCDVTVASRTTARRDCTDEMFAALNAPTFPCIIDGAIDYTTWRAAVKRLGLSTQCHADVENGPSPDDCFEPCFAVNVSGDMFGMFQMNEDEATTGCLFATKEAFDEWQHQQPNEEADLLAEQNRNYERDCFTRRP